MPSSVLDRRDWPRPVVERARRTQYETVHPAVALARASGVDEFAGAPWPDTLKSPVPTMDELRFYQGPPVETPTPEPTPPMHQMPPSRPMTPEEERQLNRPQPVVVALGRRTQDEGIHSATALARRRMSI